MLWGKCSQKQVSQISVRMVLAIPALLNTTHYHEVVWQCQVLWSKIVQKQIKNTPFTRGAHFNIFVAERQGLEPWNGSHRYSISIRAPSTGLGHLSV